MGLRTDACCCFSLRVGTLMLGYLNSTFHTLSAFMCIFSLIHIRQFLDYLVEQKSLPDDLSMSQYDLIIAAMTAFFSVSLAINIVVAILSTFLIMGVYQENEKYIKFNVYAWIAFTLMTVISVISQVIFTLTFGRYAQAWQALIFGTLTIMLYIYFTVVIHSYRLEIIERKRHGVMLSPTQKQSFNNF